MTMQCVGNLYNRMTVSLPVFSSMDELSSPEQTEEENNMRHSVRQYSIHQSPVRKERWLITACARTNYCSTDLRHTVYKTTNL